MQGAGRGGGGGGGHWRGGVPASPLSFLTQQVVGGAGANAVGLPAPLTVVAATGVGAGARQGRLVTQPDAQGESAARPVRKRKAQELGPLEAGHDKKSCRRAGEAEGEGDAARWGFGAGDGLAAPAAGRIEVRRVAPDDAQAWLQVLQLFGHPDAGPLPAAWRPDLEALQEFIEVQGGRAMSAGHVREWVTLMADGLALAHRVRAAPEPAGHDPRRDLREQALLVRVWRTCLGGDGVSQAHRSSLEDHVVERLWPPPREGKGGHAEAAWHRSTDLMQALAWPWDEGSRVWDRLWQQVDQRLDRHLRPAVSPVQDITPRELAAVEDFWRLESVVLNTCADVQDSAQARRALWGRVVTAFMARYDAHRGESIRHAAPQFPPASPQDLQAVCARVFKADPGPAVADPQQAGDPAQFQGIALGLRWGGATTARMPVHAFFQAWWHRMRTGAATPADHQRLAGFVWAIAPAGARRHAVYAMLFQRICSVGQVGALASAESRIERMQEAMVQATRVLAGEGPALLGAARLGELLAALVPRESPPDDGRRLFAPGQWRQLLARVAQALGGGGIGADALQALVETVGRVPDETFEPHLFAGVMEGIDAALAQPSSVQAVLRGLMAAPARSHAHEYRRIGQLLARLAHQGDGIRLLLAGAAGLPAPQVDRLVRALVPQGNPAAAVGARRTVATTIVSPLTEVPVRDRVLQACALAAQAGAATWDAEAFDAFVLSLLGRVDGTLPEHDGRTALFLQGARMAQDPLYHLIEPGMERGQALTLLEQAVQMPSVLPPWFASGQVSRVLMAQGMGDLREELLTTLFIRAARRLHLSDYRAARVALTLGALERQAADAAPAPLAREGKGGIEPAGETEGRVSPQKIDEIATRSLLAALYENLLATQDLDFLWHEPVSAQVVADRVASIEETLRFVDEELAQVRQGIAPKGLRDDLAWQLERIRAALQGALALRAPAVPAVAEVTSLDEDPPQDHKAGPQARASQERVARAVMDRSSLLAGAGAPTAPREGGQG